jgi:hypothetical protein
MGEKIKAGLRWIGGNLDALFVILVGGVVAVLEIVGHPSPEAVNAAILGLLAVTAIILLRIRRRRGELDDVIQVARDAMSERPFQMVWAKNEWDIESRQRATIKVRQQLRFIHNKVSTIDHWSQGGGRIESYDARWRRSEADDWVEAKKIYAMPIEGGEKVIYSFDEENCRGDILEWKVERGAVDRFPTAHEKVSLEAIARSDHPREMRIIWPADAPPTRVELRQGGTPGKALTTKEVEGRQEVVEHIPQLALGESVEIRWMW